MTGYGKANCEFHTKKILIEIKSLNSKQLDLNLRIPSIYKEKELDLRNEISHELIRGKVDFAIFLDWLDEDVPANINPTIIKSYYQRIKDISKDLNLAIPNDILSTLIRMPDTLKSERQLLTDEEWKILLETTRQAIRNLNEFRAQEGLAIEKDLIDRIYLIDHLSYSLEPFENQRIEKLKQRIKNNICDVISSDKIDQNRFEQELIYYIEKLDITEEKVRLVNHCSYFIETINEPESNGKKLGFIAQEIGREINTIGSKANDVDIQKIVIGMKDELEKIKEQLNNIL
jgi:uncharacterized protein (TIGR00255 family)